MLGGEVRKSETLTFGPAFSVRSLQPLCMPCITTLGWHPACPAKHPEAQGSAGVGGSKAPTISAALEKSQAVGSSWRPLRLSPSVLSEGRRGVTAVPPLRLQRLEVKVERWAQALKSASLGSRARLAQVHLLSFAGSKGEVAFGKVSEERRWWSVWKHTQRAGTENQVNKHHI